MIKFSEFPQLPSMEQRKASTISESNSAGAVEDSPASIDKQQDRNSLLSTASSEQDNSVTPISTSEKDSATPVETVRDTASRILCDRDGGGI